MKNLLYPLVFATAFVATACTSTNETDFDTPVDPNGKTPISFVGQSSNHGLTRAGFSADTHIAMHIRSDKSGASDVRETRTVANALKDKALDATSFSSIEPPSDENVRYWDDAFGRDANLSVFAIAVAGKGNTLKNNGNSLTDLLDGNSSWTGKKLSETVEWSVSTDQSGKNTIGEEDLVYSNNIQGDKDLGVDGVRSYNKEETATDKYTTHNNGQMKFRLDNSEDTDGPGKFDKGHLNFHHALSRITVNLVKGTGFAATGSFNFTADAEGKVGNVKFIKAPTSGSLDLEAGAWGNNPSTADIKKMAILTIPDNAPYNHSLMAQVLPGYTFTKGSNTDVLEFYIDNNKYTVSQDMMLAALNKKQNTSEESITMKQGNNYIFTITVKKKQIEVISASVVDFEKINGELALDNHHYSFDLFNGGKEITENLFTFYRYQDPTVTGIQTTASESTDWNGKYTASTNFAYDSNNKKWGTEWYYEDNTKFYHFRTTSANNVTSKNYHVATSGSDYFTMTSGAISNDLAKGTDYIWGAPIKEQEGLKTPLPYDVANGYGTYINPAIGATDADIRMTQMHMMANIKIVLITPAQPAATNNSIVLYDEENKKGCTIALTNFYTQGDVSMGNGLVTPIKESLNTDAAGQTITAPSTASAGVYYETAYTKTNVFSYSVVPQVLVDGTRMVGLIIKTPDNNQYYVVNDLSTIKVNGTDNAITRWNPGYEYTYTIKLTKTGIANITCSVVGWETVEAEPTNISLES